MSTPDLLEFLEETFTIEIVYITEFSEFRKFGKIKNYLCETKFQLQRIEQSLWLPAKYRYIVSSNTTLNHGISGNDYDMTDNDADGKLFKKTEKLSKY